MPQTTAQPITIEKGRIWESDIPGQSVEEMINPHKVQYARLKNEY